MPSASEQLWRAYDRQVQPRMEREALGRDMAQQQFQNNRLLNNDALVQEQAQRQRTQFEQTQQDRERAMREQSLNRVNAIAAKALQLQGQQRKQFLAQQIQNYAPDFEASGFDMNEVPSMMEQDDMDLENDLRARAWMVQETDEGPKIGAFNPSDYTPESFARFQQTRNAADLKRYQAPQDNGFTLGPGQTRYGPDGKQLASVAPKPDSQAGPAKLPVGALRLVDDAKQAIGSVGQSQTMIDTALNMLNSGAVDLGVVSNLIARGRNVAGVSSNQSRAYASIKQTFEKLRNNYLLLAKGVQTEGDAKRAWNSEIGESVQNDNALAKQQLEKAERLMQQMQAMQEDRIATVYSNYGAAPPETSNVQAPAATGWSIKRVR